MDRRRFLSLSSVGLAGAAGCVGSGSSGDAPTASSTETSTVTESETATPTETASGEPTVQNTPEPELRVGDRIEYGEWFTMDDSSHVGVHVTEPYNEDSFKYREVAQGLQTTSVPGGKQLVVSDITLKNIKEEESRVSASFAFLANDVVFLNREPFILPDMGLKVKTPWMEDQGAKHVSVTTPLASGEKIETWIGCLLPENIVLSEIRIAASRVFLTSMEEMTADAVWS